MNMTSLTNGQRTIRGFAAAAAFAAVALAPSVAHAADSYTGTKNPKVGAVDSGRVLGSGQVRTAGAGSTNAAAGSSRSAAAGQAGSLPVTGSDLLSLALIGFGALGVGTVLVMKTRSSSTATA